MKIEICTITGADDSVTIRDMESLSHDFLFLEWGILVSTREGPRPRMPSNKWIAELLQSNSLLMVSLHLCGAPMRDLLLGKMHDRAWLIPSFDRVQINTHGQLQTFTEEGIKAIDDISKFWATPIMQVDNVNTALLMQVQAQCGGFVDCIHDLSHGAGVVPDAWPEPMAKGRTTYAGGLGPHNLADQLKKIEDVVGDNMISIDMETHVRSEDDKRLDLDKVRQCLEIAAKYT